MGKEMKGQWCRVKQQTPDLDKELEKIAKAMLEDWCPEVQVDSFIGTHGSHKGEVIEHTSYYNELTGFYTDKEEAFAGFVMKKIKGLLSENTLNDEQKHI
ncbi:MAG TPA: hypothetical protein VKZ97_02640 [Flavobacteriaceae bacterium]|nr:hypothetical protein [Flavobacteriaceae bacterium]